jgi:hypothetical protein
MTMLTSLQIARQDRKGHHGVRTQDRPAMGRLDRRVQEPPAQEDGVDWCRLIIYLRAAFPDIRFDISCEATAGID